jgi:hypothetical protein
MSADMEMSCDERVLKELGGDIKDGYSLSLVRIAAGRRILNGSPLAFGEGGMKERIKRILTFNKPSKAIIVASVVFAILLSLGFAVNRVEGNAAVDTAYDAFIELLAGNGFHYTEEEMGDSSFLTVAHRPIWVDDGLVSVYVYGANRDMEYDASHIDVGGSSIRLPGKMVEISWASYPYWFKRDTVIINYVGQNERIIGFLRLHYDEFAGYGYVSRAPGTVAHIIDEPAIVSRPRANRASLPAISNADGRTVAVGMGRDECEIYYGRPLKNRWFTAFPGKGLSVLPVDNVVAMLNPGKGWTLDNGVEIGMPIDQVRSILGADDAIDPMDPVHGSIRIETDGSWRFAMTQEKADLPPEADRSFSGFGMGGAMF